MIGEVVDGVRARMRQAVEAEDAKVVTIRGSKAGLEGQVESARAVQAKVVTVLGAQETALAQVSTEVLEKKTALAASVEAQKSGDAPFAPMQTEKAQYEAVIAEEFQAILEGSSQTKKHCDKVVALAKKLSGVDESLMKAMPSTCLKKADARSQFDNMVLETLSKNFADHVASLTATLEAAKAGFAERAASVQAAQAAFDATKARQQAAAADVSATQAACREAQASLTAAEAAVSNFEPTLVAAEDLAGERKEALENFVTWNVSCFEMMRDKKRKPEPVQEALPVATPPAAPVADIAPVAEAAPALEAPTATLPVA